LDFIGSYRIFILLSGINLIKMKGKRFYSSYAAGHYSFLLTILFMAIYYLRSSNM
jgi:hypothetical protein